MGRSIFVQAAAIWGWGWGGENCLPLLSGPSLSVFALLAADSDENNEAMRSAGQKMLCARGVGFLLQVSLLKLPACRLTTCE